MCYNYKFNIEIYVYISTYGNIELNNTKLFIVYFLSFWLSEVVVVLKQITPCRIPFAFKEFW